METAYVLWWTDASGPSAGVVRVYLDKARGEEDLVLLQHESQEGHPDPRIWQLTETPCIGRVAKKG